MLTRASTSDFAAAHPTATVTGFINTPYSFCEDTEQCKFQLANVNQPWNKVSDSFDLIRGDGLILNVSDWNALMNQALSCLRPGGYFELFDRSFEYTGKYEGLDEGHPWAIAAAYIRRLAARVHQDSDMPGPGRYKFVMEVVGFRNVRESRRKVQVLFESNIIREHIECLLLRYFHAMAWMPSQVEDFMRYFREDLAATESDVYVDW